MPDYPKLAQLWWQNIADAVVRREDAAAGDGRARRSAGRGAGRLEKSGVQGDCGPKLNPKRDRCSTGSSKAKKDGNIAPQPKLANEKPKGETIDYDTLIKTWPATPPKK